jgi:integrase/recombinase XerD
MSALQEALDEYLAARRALGHKLLLSGRLLKRFVTFADSAGATHITAEIALAWAMQPAKAQPAQWANRLAMVRRFARYCHAIEPRTIVPPDDLLPHRYRRPSFPYIYRDNEIAELIVAAKRLPSRSGLRPQTFATLFGLYAATGMRCNEPLRLDRSDVDLANGVLTIRGTKFGKSRYVPVHAGPPINAAGPADLCKVPRPMVRESDQPKLLSFRTWDAFDRMGRPLDVRQTFP